MLLDIVDEYDSLKIEFLLNLWEKSIIKLATIEDTKKIVSFLNRWWIIWIDDKKQIIYVWIPNEFILLQARKFFKKSMNITIKEIYNINFSVEFVVYEKFQSWRHKLQKDLSKILWIKKTNWNCNIDEKTKDKLQSHFWILFDPRYKFDNFIVWSNNQLAYSAAISIAENPGKVHNPFFIYWDVWLWKTHLLQAIGNYTIEKNKEKVVVYLPTSNLIDEIVLNIRKNTLSNLMKKLEEVDILILDDIQFLAWKDKTQEIFHNIFNDFHMKQKQIILSSDRPPKELDLLEARLRSRFSLWLITDIKKPDFETRMAIIISKLREKSEELDWEFVDIIAKYVNDNVREIEWAINIILTRKNLLWKELVENDIYEALETLWYRINWDSKIDAKINSADDMNTKSLKSFWNIVEYIWNYYWISVIDIKWENRKKEVSTARQMLMYIAKKHYWWTLEKIWLYFWWKNHATVIYAINNFEKLLKNNKKIYNDYHIIINDV